MQKLVRYKDHDPKSSFNGYRITSSNNREEAVCISNKNRHNAFREDFLYKYSSAKVVSMCDMKDELMVIWELQ